MDRELCIRASGLSLRSRRGSVYEAVDLAVPTGAVAVIAGSAGSGRTSLLLTLAGRMRATSGTALVCGIDLMKRPRAVRRLVGLGVLAGVNDLEPSLTAADQLRAELAMYGRTPDDELVREALDRVGFAAAPSAAVRDLSALDRTLLGVALGVSGRPRVLVLDDVDRELTRDELSAFGCSLLSLTADGLTIVAASADPTSLEAAHMRFTLGETKEEVA